MKPPLFLSFPSPVDLRNGLNACGAVAAFALEDVPAKA